MTPPKSPPRDSNRPQGILVGPLRLARICPLALVAFGACGEGPTQQAEVELVGQFFALLSIDGAPLPTRYYISPDGQFEVAADRGSLFFESESVVEWSTGRLITWYGPPPRTEDAGGHEVMRYRFSGNRLWVARSEAVWDGGRLEGGDIFMSFTHEGIPLGEWRFRRD